MIVSIIGLFTFPPGGNQNQQRSVTFMWRATLCRGLMALSTGQVKHEIDLQIFKEKKHTSNIF